MLFAPQQTPFLAKAQRSPREDHQESLSLRSSSLRSWRLREKCFSSAAKPGFSPRRRDRQEKTTKKTLLEDFLLCDLSVLARNAFFSPN
jgi:hypothetical protein